MATLELPVLGMTCAACVRRVEKAIGKVAGVGGVDVNLVLSRARIAIEGADDGDQLRNERSFRNVAERVVAAVKSAGYEVPADALVPERAVRELAVERARAEEVGGLRRDAAIAIALEIPLIALGMMEVAIWVQAALGTAIVVGPGRRYWVAGTRAALHGAPDMNTLIALGVAAAWGASVASLAAGGGGPLYFEAAGAIVAFVMIGKLLEARVRARLVGVARGLVELTPAVAHRLAAAGAGDGAGAGAVVDVAAADLVAGDVMLVRPGERLAADGTVIGGAGTVDESLLTGESLPVDKREGSPVYAGTLAQLGALEVRVARAGAATALARIARAVEDAQGDKAKIARLADRVSAVFVPAVLAIAAATFAIWWLAAGAAPAVALERAIAVLVIACPCALGLATPAAVAVGTARAAEVGVLFRGGLALEAASTITTIALDKTGTLTEGAPSLTEVVAFPSTARIPRDEVLALAAAAELASEHPIARAIVDGARARGLPLAKATATEVTPGGGIRATVDGRVVRVGTREFAMTPETAAVAVGDVAEIAEIAGAGVDADTGLARLEKLAADGNTLAFVAIDGALAGGIAVADTARPEAAATVAALRAAGLRVVMITGDRAGPAHAIARIVGIAAADVHAAIAPTQKAAIVRQLASAIGTDPGSAIGTGAGNAVGTGTGSAIDISGSAIGTRLVTRGRRGGRGGNSGGVAMVGDGINDAPALAAATLGIALASGTDLAAAAADVTIFRGGLATVPIALALARATLATIRRNLAAAFVYNAICIPLAAAGLLSPMLAAAAMSLSSISVLLSSLALRPAR